MRLLIGDIGVLGLILPNGTAAIRVYDPNIVIQQVTNAPVLLDVAVFLYVVGLPTYQGHTTWSLFLLQAHS